MARKVALVPQELLNSLMGQQQLTPSYGHLNKLDQDLKSVLEQNVAPDVKFKVYNQLMHQYEGMKNEALGKQPAVEPKQLVLEEPDLLQGLPKNLINKGKLLLQHVKRNPAISWDDKGRVSVHGQVVPESNITDLIHDFTRPQRQGHAPAAGWREFGQALRDSHVPREAVVNKQRLRMLDGPVQDEMPPLLQRIFATPNGAAQPKRVFASPRAAQHSRQRVFASPDGAAEHSRQRIFPSPNGAEQLKRRSQRIANKWKPYETRK